MSQSRVSYLALFLFLFHIDSPLAFASAQDCNYQQTAVSEGSGTLLVAFASGSGAAGVQLVYDAGGTAYTVPMSLSNNAWSVAVTGLSAGETVTYYFTYTIGGAPHQTDLFSFTYNSPVNTMPSGQTRGIWIWNTTTVLSSASQISALITGAQSIGVSDLYLYMSPSSYSAKKAALQSLIASATTAGLRVWGLDGDRAYFADATGPTNFYAGINNLIAYNNSVAANARFFGFQADNEPQDDGTHMSFHSGIADSALSTQAGSGVWQSTQAQDREMLLRSWLTMHQTAQNLLHAHGLRFGAAMPFWTESYYGGQVQVSFPGSSNTHQGVMKYMMALLDDYVIMSYNTNPSNAASRVVAQAAYASTLPTASQPRVYGSMEVTAGVGANVSYADTPGKNSKAVVMQDMQTIIKTLSQYPAFKGMALEQWSAWQVLPN